MMMLTEEGTPVPPVVYVPTQRLRADDTETTLELRHLTSGQLALLAYSSLDRLVDGCGEFQPWALIPSPRIEELRAHAGFDVVALDVGLPPECRHAPDTSDQPEETR